MKFYTSRTDALNQLNNFIDNDILNYSSKRNFDYGFNNRKNVSCLSPYLTHRLITEFETIKKVLKKHPFQKVDKYIQEIFWRVYWKGWLELRPNVWSDFIDDLKSIKEDKKYLKAINANTEINCFNDWVKELKNYNYLHNHTRMLFASIWIFTLGLPWQKGAEFFMRYLFDGDAASNTLSWRWVAGLQTKGKHYLAQSWNISKFTNNKYKNVKLNQNALPVIDKRDYKISPLKIDKTDITNDQLLIFDNELDTQFLELQKYKKIYFILLTNNTRSIKLDVKVLDFKKKIINSQVEKIDQETKIIDENGLINITENSKNFDAIYPSIGENLSFFKRKIKENDLKVNFITKKEDDYCWKYSTKGYFNFKLNIPTILSYFKLN